MKVSSALYSSVHFTLHSNSLLHLIWHHHCPIRLWNCRFMSDGYENGLSYALVSALDGKTVKLESCWYGRAVSSASAYWVDPHSHTLGMPSPALSRTHVFSHTPPRPNNDASVQLFFTFCPVWPVDARRPYALMCANEVSFYTGYYFIKLHEMSWSVPITRPVMRQFIKK